jgi:hypothetical protein
MSQSEGSRRPDLGTIIAALHDSEIKKEALEKAIAVASPSFEMFVRERVPWHRPEDYAHMLEGLRKAGWEG